MIAATDRRVVQTAAQIAVHNPWFIEFLQEWRAREVDMLVQGPEVIEALFKQRGRVQAIDELLRLIQQAVDIEHKRA